MKALLSKILQHGCSWGKYLKAIWELTSNYINVILMLNDFKVEKLKLKFTVQTSLILYGDYSHPEWTEAVSMSWGSWAFLLPSYGHRINYYSVHPHFHPSAIFSWRWWARPQLNMEFNILAPISELKLETSREAPSLLLMLSSMWMTATRETTTKTVTSEAEVTTASPTSEEHLEYVVGIHTCNKRKFIGIGC